MECTREFDFTLILSGVDAVDSQLEDALFEAGCDDATISTRFGCVYVTFARQATSMLEAVLSAINDIEGANTKAEVLRVDDCSLVTQAEIARKCGRSRQVIQLYINGQRGPGKFPPPACRVIDRQPLWDWCEVSQWLVENQMIREEDFAAAHDIDMINSYLDWERQKALSTERFAPIQERLSRGRIQSTHSDSLTEFC